MANLQTPPNPAFPDDVYELGIDDPVQGGPGGIDNQPHQQLWNASRHLKVETTNLSAVAAAIQQRLTVLEGSAAAVVGRVVQLDTTYRDLKVAFELFTDGWTFIDMPELAPVDIVNGVAGDESLDISSTAPFQVGQDYVLFGQAAPQSVRVTHVLTANRLRFQPVLAASWTGGKISRTNWTIGLGQAIAGDAGVYYSKAIDLGPGSALGGRPHALIMRRTNNDAVLTVWWMDADHLDWVEAPWAWRRDLGDGQMDYEYALPTSGSLRLKITSAHGASQQDAIVYHLVGQREATGLGGEHRPPLLPVNAAPAANATGMTDQPTLALAAYHSLVASVQAGLQVQLAPAADFAAVFHDSGIRPAGLSYTLPAGLLSVSTAYFWRARVRDYEGAWSDWSTPTKFTTASTFAHVSTPIGTSPTQGQTDVGQRPTLYCLPFAVAGGVDVHLATEWEIRSADGSYAAPVFAATTETGIQSVQVDGALLQPATTYFWRLRQSGETLGWSEWSEERSFATRASFGVIVGLALVQTGGTAGNWARIDEAGSPRAFAPSDFQNHPVYAGIADVTIAAQYMVRIPKFYYRADYLIGGPYAGKMAWQISDQPHPGFTLHPAFMEQGQPIDQFWVAKYQGDFDTNSVPRSYPGGGGYPSHTVNGVISAIPGLNVGGQTGFMLWSIYQFAAIQMLALVEMGGSDSQTLIGRGHVDGGDYDLNNTASVATATWRGIVGLWGNVVQMVDGFKFTAGTATMWDRNGHRQYVSTNYNIPGGGYPVSMSTVSGPNYDLRDMFMPASIDQLANASFPDYFGPAQGGDQYPTFGGAIGSGSDAGLFAISSIQFNNNEGFRIAKV